ncbi:TetR/AcrR family transcriptional regulator [Pseudonocardia cypriaca]|uniref:TetR family transcriptional regulator n=1 Tax=Pseudonocardia cypriaca TaxID=882449 RepID=A0A543FYF3_9PSEU|nr:TetR/AcrR family transcriptional regulator [Pseudonocardia cypriaca]TQM38870.1 TetR family transcriptional regulator [Pseudonocardia cypriaca]
MPARTRRRGEALEHAIHRATLDELADAGYAALTMDGIARRAQTGKAALYRRWAGKRELVLDALLGVLPDPGEVAPSASVRDELLATLTIMADTVAGRSRFPSLDVLLEVLRVPELRDAFASRVIEPRLRMVHGILRRGAERGEIDPARISTLVARAGPALVIETFLLTGAPPPGDELARIVDTIVMPLLSPIP